MPHVLVIGAMSAALGSLIHSLKQQGATILQTDSIKTAPAIARTQRDVTHIFCDAKLNIAELRASLAADGIDVAIIACVVTATSGLGERLALQGAHDVLPLPSDAETLTALLQSNSASRRPLVAHDPVMIDVLKRAIKVAASEASILILGESGTGKEMLARHIHQHSNRSTGPFVAVNCAALPDTLIESELFGFEKGAFSGAHARRIGKFEAAHGGTLLLDEVGEVDIRLQAKLLRAIQEREIDRVGGDRPIKIDVRILATTNRNLRQEILNGNFREDLYYRINVVSLEIPPLRTRPADILPIAGFFAAKFAALNGLPMRPIPDAMQKALLARRWQGNVRELENAIHRSVLTSFGSDLNLECHPEADSTRHIPEIERTDREFASSNAKQLPVFVGSRLEEVERSLILETLEHTQGNRTHAATMLGISIRSLRNKIREYSSAGNCVRAPNSTSAAS